MGSGNLLGASSRLGSRGHKPELDLQRKLKMKRNREVEADMISDVKVEAALKMKKLLLLGAGGSGKSTVFKQMKVIYGDQYSELERRQHLPIIYGNVLNSMKILADQAVKMDLDGLVECKEQFNMVRGSFLDTRSTIDIETGDAIKTLWCDKGIKAVWERRNEFQITESVQYYFNRIDNIKLPGYVPDKDDILYSRSRTSGIVTERYNIDGTIFEMYDVGGQRNERRKWIHCFEGVSAIIFVASISEYDQCLYEDCATNRTVESLDLFESICNNSLFRSSSLILFLNMKDLFEQKIQTKHIRDIQYFRDFKGPDSDFDAGVKYFLTKYLAKNTMKNRQIYHHVTCATDTRNVRVVFGACKDIILKQNLQESGFME